jgi:hypothetical protein
VVGSLKPYLIISRALVEKRLTPQEFETVFLSVFRSEGDLFSEAITSALDRLFAEVDAYSPDPEVRDDDGLDDAGLISAVALFLHRVQEAGEEV